MGKHYIGKGLTLPSISYKRFLKLKLTRDFANGCIVNVYDKSNHENDGIYACINDKFYKLQVIDDIQGNNIAQGVQGIQGAQGTQGFVTVP